MTVYVTEFQNYLRKKQFEIERKSIKEASILKLKNFLIEENNLISSLRKNFILQYF